jgi:hypothetical protein
LEAFLPPYFLKFKGFFIKEGTNLISQNLRKNIHIVKNYQIFLHEVLTGSQNIKGFLKYKLPYLVCSQIWLNLIVDNE